MSQRTEEVDGRAGRGERRTQRREKAAARRRALTRQASQSRSAQLLRLRRPAERAGHQASTAHVQAAYPAQAEAGLGSRGVYIGADAHGGSFSYDPWVLYAARILSNANTIVLGMLGHGKSALTKSYLWRQRVFGRVVEIIDPKGEYLPLVRAMGGRVLRLEPGGDVRLNPLTQIGTREMREGLLEAVTKAMLERSLTQAEAVGLMGALGSADLAAHDGETTIPDVIKQLRDPDAVAADRLGMTQLEARGELRECALALLRLCDGPLRGMFDGATTAGEDVWDAPAVCLDLSAVGVGAAESNRALGIMMVCASAFLDAKRADRARRAEEAGEEPTKVIRANDEAWRALPIAGLGEYYQAAFKLSRATGVQHWLVLHRLSDLRAAGDEGSRQQRLAEGLLSDASTIVCYRQHPGEVAITADLLGLSSTEAELIAGLGDGEALWRVAARSFQVQHVLSDREWELVATDTAMTDRPRDALERQASHEAAQAPDPLEVDVQTEQPVDGHGPHEEGLA